MPSSTQSLGVGQEGFLAGILGKQSGQILLGFAIFMSLWFWVVKPEINRSHEFAKTIADISASNADTARTLLKASEALESTAKSLSMATMELNKERP